MADNLSGFTGSFVPTTNVWDVSELYSVNVNSPEFKELLVRLYQNVNLIALVLNTKDSGYYFTEDFVTGKLFFPDPTLSSATSSSPEPRPSIRKVVIFGALPNNTTKSVPHGITVNSGTRFVETSAQANDTTGFSYLKIPFASPTLADNISLLVDATNVTITTGSNRSNFNDTLVFLEWLQN